MNIKRFLYLEAALKHGSFRRAAVALGISQPSVSEQIRRLEEDLDLDLLVRTPSGVRPTEAATELLPLISNLAAAERALTCRAEELRPGERGKITIGAVSLFMVALVPRMVAEVQARFPDATVEIVEAGTRRILQQVADRELGLGLIVRSPAIRTNYEGLRFVDLAEGKLHVTLDARDPLAARTSIPMVELRGRRFVTHAPQTFVREVFDSFREHYELRIQSVADSGPSTHRLISGSRGIAFSTATDFMLPEAPRTLVHRTVVDPTTPLVLSIALRSDERSSVLASTVVRLVRKQCTSIAWPPGFTPVQPV